MRRFTHLTNAFSKKLENHAAAISLHFMYYNLRENSSNVARHASDGKRPIRSRMESRQNSLLPVML